mgnify:CR=1 FL=1
MFITVLIHVTFYNVNIFKIDHLHIILLFYLLILYGVSILL